MCGAPWAWRLRAPASLGFLGTALSGEFAAVQAVVYSCIQYVDLVRGAEISACLLLFVPACSGA